MFKKITKEFLEENDINAEDFNDMELERELERLLKKEFEKEFEDETM